MEPLLGNDLRNMWQECEPAIGRKIAASYDISANDIRRCVASITTLPPPSAPESPFFLTLGTPAQQQCPPLNSTLAQRTKEEWARTLCENKAVAIIQRMQEGKPALIPKECEEILIAIALDRPLKEAQRLVENPERFFNPRHPFWSSRAPSPPFRCCLPAPCLRSLCWCPCVCVLFCPSFVLPSFPDLAAPDPRCFHCHLAPPCLSVALLVSCVRVLVFRSSAPC